MSLENLTTFKLEKNHFGFVSFFKFKFVSMFKCLEKMINNELVFERFS